MNTRLKQQQPIAKTVGRRVSSPAGVPPTPEARRAWDAMANYRTHAPKGVFAYRTHDEMTRDRERWVTEAFAARAR